MESSGPGLNAPEQPDGDHDRHSNFRLEVTLAIGYQRRRSVLGGAWEGHIVTVVLLVGGVVLVLFFLWNIFRALGAL